MLYVLHPTSRPAGHAPSPSAACALRQSSAPAWHPGAALAGAAKALQLLLVVLAVLAAPALLALLAAPALLALLAAPALLVLMVLMLVQVVLPLPHVMTTAQAEGAAAG